MKYPKFLKEGNTLAYLPQVLGPTSNLTNQDWNLPLEINLKCLGYKMIKGDIFGYFNGASSAKESRAQAFMDLYKDPNVDFIWSVGGGEWMMEIIPLINFEELKHYPPKFFYGLF